MKKGDIKHWENVTLPYSFTISTIVIIISSITIHFMYLNVKNSSKYRLFAITTLILSFVFVFLQLNGWNQLKSANVLFTGNPSGTFIYVVSLLHGLHYVGGIFFLLLLSFLYRKGNLTLIQIENINILAQYWHYIGIVWVLLFLFFKFLIYN